MSAHPLPAGWLMAYYDGELDPAGRDQVETHLATCAGCRQELAQLRALSHSLAAAELPAQNAAGPALAPGEFWQRVQAQLPERQPARPAAARLGSSVSLRRLLLRWSPGLGLLLLNGLVQVLALALTVLLLLLPLSLAQAPAWATGLAQLAAGATLGWLAWLVPASWSGWALIGFWLIVSANLALLYLAWLGYELRHGPSATFGRLAAREGA